MTFAALPQWLHLPTIYAHYAPVSLLAVWGFCTATLAAEPLRTSAAEDNEVSAALEQARAAMNSGAWPQAELWLERALMLRPEQAEAMLLWAQVLIRRGQIDSAKALLIALRDDARTPPLQQRELQAWLAQLQPSRQGEALEPTKEIQSAGTRESIRYQWEWGVGYSQNPLIQTSASQVTLTLPAGDTTLSLQNKPEPGWNTGVRIAMEQAGRWAISGQVQALPGRDAGSMRLTGVWALHSQWMVFAQAQRLADTTRRVQLGLQTGLRLGSQAQLGAQWGVYRDLDQNREGVTPRVTATFQGALPGAATRGAWTFHTWWEREGERIAAAAPSWRGRGALFEAKSRNQMKFLLQLSDQKDEAGYSPLLNNNAPRSLQTYSSALEWAWAGSLDRGWIIRVHAANRRANHALFEWKDAGSTLLWRSSM